MRSTLPAFNEVWQRQFRTRFLTQLLQFPKNTQFLIGCSGGMDSMLLLYLMAVLCPQQIRAIYINHQLQAANDDWAIFVAEQCQQLNIPYIVEHVQVAEGNLENQARAARYQAYQKHLHPNDILVLAHHQQDQAETVMLRLLSGAGVSGLSAMKVMDERENLTLWRPLLDISREQICQWVEQSSLPYVDDPTNMDTHYDRAWCRHELWNILQSRYPKMQQALARTSYLMQDAQEILSDILQQDLAVCTYENRLDLAKLNGLTSARQRQLLSAWMKGQDTYRPSFEMVQRLQQEVILSKSDAQAALHWNEYYYVRFRQFLYRLDAEIYLESKKEQAFVAQNLECDLEQKISVASGDFQIQVQKVGLSYSLLRKKLELNHRRGGEKIHLYGRVGTWALKKAIQDAHIFPWMRHTIQILSIDNVMLGVFTPNGFWLAQSDYVEVNGWQPNLVS
ncbi:tRNA lysidine(34) synthetase TilS [Acinetobacter sp. R933-2]|uniref:tRNA lysidine(34) synthetase TilS n=1 Tax=Acinetobacter sp. R933-2 TaxID=2746728 RepID=UPI0025750A8E|nr:tRNA lysidine(34) synthetase TilS [Acinetobacter sp. R933-2]MDM1245804.1 tRNA lysidine(34) synthetase TilS [Acinetobacter sp. R933-2]